MTHLALRKFDMTRIQFAPDENTAPMVLVTGKRNAGKTFLVCDLMHHQQDIPVGIVVSCVEADIRAYSNLVPAIHTAYDPAIIKNVLTRQTMALRKPRTPVLSDPRAFVVLDDCLHGNTWMRDKCMQELFMNHRHQKVMTVIAMQIPSGIPPIMRGMIEFVFILREDSIANRKRIYENYASMFPTFEAFCQAMDRYTDNHGCLVIDTTCSRHAELEDRVFHYTADSRADFCMEPARDDDDLEGLAAAVRHFRSAIAANENM